MAEKPPAHFIQALEQLTAMYRDFAGTVVVYFKTLLTHGMTREEALALALAWQTEMIRGMNARMTPPGKT